MIMLFKTTNKEGEWEAPLEWRRAADGNEDEDDDFGEKKGQRFQERGIGVDLGVDSDEEIEELEKDDDDDDLFVDDKDGQLINAETLKQRREEGKKARAKMQKGLAEKGREAQSLTMPFHGAASIEGEEDDHIGDEEKEKEAMWIMGHILNIALEYFSPPPLQPHDG
eukprot:10692011-Ditylum_brightwellii.AAC.1